MMSETWTEDFKNNFGQVNNTIFYSPNYTCAQYYETIYNVFHTDHSLIFKFSSEVNRILFNYPFINVIVSIGRPTLSVMHWANFI